MTFVPYSSPGQYIFSSLPVRSNKYPLLCSKLLLFTLHFLCNFRSRDSIYSVKQPGYLSSNYLYMKHSGVDVNCRGRLHVLLLILTLNLRFPNINLWCPDRVICKSSTALYQKAPRCCAVTTHVVAFLRF